MKSNKNTSIETMDFQTSNGNTSLRVINDETSIYNMLYIFNNQGVESVMSFEYDGIKNYGDEQGGEIKKCVDDFFKFYHETFGYFTMGCYKHFSYLKEKYPKLSRWYDLYSDSVFICVYKDEHDEPLEDAFNKMKEEYKEEMLRFLKEFGMKMVNDSLDLNSGGYHYFEDKEDEDMYCFGLSSIVDGFDEFDHLMKETLNFDINKIHYGL